MSYSLTNSHATGAKSSVDGGAPAPAAGASPLRKSPRVILHPNGRPGSSGTKTAAASLATTLVRHSSTDGDSGGSTATSPALAAPLGTPRGAAAALATKAPAGSGAERGVTGSAPRRPSAKNTEGDLFLPMKSVLSRLPQGVTSPVSQEALRRTEEQMEEIKRKLDAMHADIRRLAPPATATAPSLAVTSPAAAPALGGALGTPSAAAAALTGSSTRTRNPLDASATPLHSRPPSEAGARGGAHHLSPLPSVQPSMTAKSAAAVASSTPPAAMLGKSTPSERAPRGARMAAPAPPAARDRFSLDANGILESPRGSSDSDSDSDSATSSDDGKQPAKAGARPGLGGGEGAAAATTAVSPPVRQGFGFKRPEKPPGAAAAGGRPGGRGIHMAAGEALPSTTPVSPKPAALEAPMRKEAGPPAEQLSVVGRAAARRLSEEASASRSSADRPTRENSAGGGPCRRGVLFSEEAGGAECDNTKAADAIDQSTRLRSRVVRSIRERFFAPVPRMEEVLGSRVADREAIAQLMLPGAPCSWLSCIALAVSCVTGVPTTIEKILRANHLGVHYLGLQAITLAQLYDLTSDYIHSRFHRTAAHNSHCEEDEFEEDEEAAKYLGEEELRMLIHVHCEMATMDTDVIDHVDEADASYGMGEHAPVTSLAQFRKALIAHANDEKSLYILNYDPYIIEEHETRLRANNAESEEEEAAIWAGMLHSKGASQGAFGILTSFNAVQHTVTFVAPHITKEQHPMHPVAPEEGQGSQGEPASAEEAEVAARCRFNRFAPVLANLVLEEHTVSLQCLYEALKQKDAYTQLCRGFVRVFVSEDFSPKVPSIFPLFVLDGSSAAGLMTTTLDVTIAPHVLGLAMTHHLSVTFLLSDSARRKQSSRNLLSKANVCDVRLRGIPLTKICQQLRLPLSMIVGHSNKESIAMAFAWYTTFLRQLQVNTEVRLGLVRPYRRGGAEDGQPSITEEEFLRHLKVSVSSQSVMLISYDINIALNVRINNSAEPAHFGIVIGVDEERGIVRIADVNVKRFRKTWHVPFYRLYNAVMGYGYMVAARDKKTIKALGGKADQEQALSCGRYELPPLTESAVVRFEYPRKAYAITVLADAVARLGFNADVEKFLNFSGFHITYFLSRHLPLEGAAAVVQNYSHYALDDAITVTTTHYDYTAFSEPPLEATGVDSTDPAAVMERRASVSMHAMLTEADLLAEIKHALESRSTRQLILKYDVSILSSDTRVFNGSYGGGSFAIVVDYESLTNRVILNDCDPEVFYRTFAVPLPLLFRAVGSWDNEDMRSRGTLLITKERSQEAVYVNSKGYDFAHALVHHPFRPVFSATCACLALAATELMMNIETPTLLSGAPLAIEDEEKRKYKRYNNIFSAEDILYALPSFSVHDWQRRGAETRTMGTAAMANAAYKRLRLPLEAVEVANAADGTTVEEHADALRDPSAFLRACKGTSGLLTITLVLFDTDAMYGVPGTSMGLVNRVVVYDEEDDEKEAEPGSARASGSKGTVQLLEGEPCRWGVLCERTAEEMMPMVRSIICVTEAVDK